MNWLNLLSSTDHIFQLFFLFWGLSSFSGLLWLLWFIWQLSTPSCTERDIRFLSRKTSARSKGWSGEQLTIQVPCCWLLPLLQSEISGKTVELLWHNSTHTLRPKMWEISNSTWLFVKTEVQLWVSRAVSSQGTHCTFQSCVPACVFSKSDSRGAKLCVVPLS